jgi:hypothetical protein
VWSLQEGYLFGDVFEPDHAVHLDWRLVLRLKSELN